jgi:transposase-like protein
MNLCLEFVQLASQQGTNRRELCQRYGICAKTGYKWLKRYGLSGEAGLEDR